MRYHGSDIDGPTLSPPGLHVRGKDLNELVGRISYVEAVCRLFTPDEPVADTVRSLDEYLGGALLALRADNPAFRLVRFASQAGCTASQAIIAGLMPEQAEAASSEACRQALSRAGIGERVQEGLRYLAFLPAWLACAVESRAAADSDPIAARIDAACNDDYVTAMYRLVRGTPFVSEGQRRVFESLLVAWHAGFGMITPTVLAPRVAIGTGVPIRQALAAGFAAAGPWHVGACQHVLEIYERIFEGGQANGDTRQETDRQIDFILKTVGRMPGFGHPLFEVDPRPDHLRLVVSGTDLEGNEAFMVYDRACDKMKAERGLHPNIDFITGAALWALGIRAPQYGSCLGCCARAAAMLAHILEREKKPPFGVNSRTAREYFDNLATDWL